MIRRFRADYIKTDEGTGIGIVEYGKYWDKQTIAIHSLYEPKNISNRDASMIIFQQIFYDLEDDEQAFLEMHKFSYRKGWSKPYKSKLNVNQTRKTTGNIYQAKLLAMDALRRKTSISETFDEPMTFSVVQAQKEERANADR